MNKHLQRGIVLLSTIILVAFLGCSAMMDGVTPCHIDERIGEYTEEPMVSYLPYTSLWDAKRLNRELDRKHEKADTDLVRLIEDNDDFYTFLKDAHAIHMAGAQEFQDNVFNPTGPIGALILATTGVSIGAFGISKPGDKKKLTELQKTNGNGSTV